MRIGMNSRRLHREQTQQQHLIPSAAVPHFFLYTCVHSFFSHCRWLKVEASLTEQSKHHAVNEYSLFMRSNSVKIEQDERINITKITHACIEKEVSFENEVLLFFDRERRLTYMISLIHHEVFTALVIFTHKFIIVQHIQLFTST